LAENLCRHNILIKYSRPLELPAACFDLRRSFQRQGEDTLAAHVVIAVFHADAAAVRLDGEFAEGQPQAKAAWPRPPPKPTL
jgi:hypothetical protein